MNVAINCGDVLTQLHQAGLHYSRVTQVWYVKVTTTDACITLESCTTVATATENWWQQQPLTNTDQWRMKPETWYYHRHLNHALKR